MRPYVRTLSSTCIASSRVGTRIRTRTGWRAGENDVFACSRRRSRIGSVKAAVLPVPVWAAARTSRPWRTRGMAWDWTGVGVFVALLDDGLEEVGRQAERIEGQVVSCGPDRGACAQASGEWAVRAVRAGRRPAVSLLRERSYRIPAPPTALRRAWAPAAGITKRRPGYPGRRGSRERRAAGEPGARGVENGVGATRPCAA